MGSNEDFPSLPKWDLLHFYRDNNDILRLDKQMIIHSMPQLLDAFRKSRKKHYYKKS
mgnify:CR=1 FL=1